MMLRSLHTPVLGETTMGQALWADPQFMPGRGPSKRVRSNKLIQVELVC